MTDFYVRFIKLPYHINAVVVPNNDNTFDIYINKNLDEYHRQKALNHELKHIKNDHFYNDLKSIEIVENEAKE